MRLKLKNKNEKKKKRWELNMVAIDKEGFLDPAWAWQPARKL